MMTNMTIISKSLRWFAMVFLMLLIVATAFFSSVFPNGLSHYTAIIMLLAAVVIVAVGQKLISTINHFSPKQRKMVVIGLTVLIILSQVWIAFNFIDSGRADSFFVRNQAVALASGSLNWNKYFRVYANNVNDALLVSWLVRFTRFFGFSDPWLVINLLQFAWLYTALFAGYRILNSWHKQSGQIIFALTWFLCAPLYAYGVFIYSDPIVMPITIDVLALWLEFQKQIGKKRLMLVGLMTLLLVFGTLIKANMVVAVLAFVGLIGITCYRKQLRWKWGILWIIGLIMCLGLMTGLMHTVARDHGYQANSNQTLPFTSWIAMSLNPNWDGEYNYADAHAQMMLPTKKQKTQSEMKLIQTRLKNFGINGLLVHFALKMRVFLTNGTFGCFQLTSQWQTAPGWYIKNKSQINFWLTIWTQLLYLSLLMNLIIMFWLHKFHLENGFLVLFVLGLGAFHIVFWEVETRYALPLLPIILLWSSVGQSELVTLCYPVLSKVKGWHLIIIGLTLAMLSSQRIEFRAVLPSHIVTEQNDGKYFSNVKIKVQPQQTLTTRIVVPGENSKLQLTPTKNTKTMVRIRIKKGRKILKTTLGNAWKRHIIHYGKQAAGILTVTIKNVGKTPVLYGDAKANYPVASYHIQGHNNLYLRYFVLK